MEQVCAGMYADTPERISGVIADVNSELSWSVQAISGRAVYSTWVLVDSRFKRAGADQPP